MLAASLRVCGQRVQQDVRAHKHAAHAAYVLKFTYFLYEM